MTLMIVVVISSMLFSIVDLSIQNLARNLLNLAQSGLILYFSAHIVRDIVDPAKSTPKKLQKFILWIILTHFIAHMIEIPLGLWLRDVKLGFGFFIRPVYLTVLYGIWYIYFQRSKRVKSYYGVDKTVSSEQVY